MKKVALALNSMFDLEHFGHCDQFAIYEIEGTNILKESFVVNPEHKPGFLPKFLVDQGVSVVIAGNLGQMAKKVFDGFGVQVFFGLEGYKDQVIASYLLGDLNSSDECCPGHGDHHEGHHHH